VEPRRRQLTSRCRRVRRSVLIRQPSLVRS
jgi:hypothetical protein